MCKARVVKASLYQKFSRFRLIVPQTNQALEESPFSWPLNRMIFAQERCETRSENSCGCVSFKEIFSGTVIANIRDS